jgi:glycosyltransferase involved in cell wall biosynthesis
MNDLTLSYSLADQSFERTKSLGILNLSVHLARELAHSDAFKRFTLFSNRSLASRIELPAGCELHEFGGPAGNSAGRIAWDQWRCYSEARRTGNRWLFLPKGFASFVRKPPVRIAVYVHDAMHDFYAERFPNTIGGFESWYFRRALSATLRDASVIFTNTEFTRSEVARLAKKFGVPEPRTHLAGIGFHAPGTAAPAGPRNRILVSTARWPHKRSELAVDWVRRWQERSKFSGDIHVVGALLDAVKVPADSNWTHHLRLAEPGYGELVRSAGVLVYFSEYEGFGMPPVEAALAGACPVFSDLSVTREVMRETGFRFSNDDFESFSRAMDGAVATSAETVGGWGRELLARHSWDLVVERIIRGLRETG